MVVVITARPTNERAVQRGAGAAAVLVVFGGQSPPRASHQRRNRAHGGQRLVVRQSRVGRGADHARVEARIGPRQMWPSRPRCAGRAGRRRTGPRLVVLAQRADEALSLKSYAADRGRGGQFAVFEARARVGDQTRAPGPSNCTIVLRAADHEPRTPWRTVQRMKMKVHAPASAIAGARAGSGRRRSGGKRCLPRASTAPQARGGQPPPASGRGVARVRCLVRRRISWPTRPRRP